MSDRRVERFGVEYSPAAEALCLKVSRIAAVLSELPPEAGVKVFRGVLESYHRKWSKEHLNLWIREMDREFSSVPDNQPAEQFPCLWHNVIMWVGLMVRGKLDADAIALSHLCEAVTNSEGQPSELGIAVLMGCFSAALHDWSRTQVQSWQMLLELQYGAFPTALYLLVSTAIMRSVRVAGDMSEDSELG